MNTRQEDTHLNRHVSFFYQFQNMGKNKLKPTKKGKTAAPTVTTAEDGHAASQATGTIREATVALTR